MSWDSGGRKRIWGGKQGDKTEDFIFKTGADVLEGIEVALRVCIPHLPLLSPCHQPIRFYLPLCSPTRINLTSDQPKQGKKSTHWLLGY